MNSTKNIGGTTLCQKGFFDVKGLESAGSSQKFKCTICGKIHGGVYSTTVCQQCYEKGHK